MVAWVSCLRFELVVVVLRWVGLCSRALLCSRAELMFFVEELYDSWIDYRNNVAS